MFLCQVSELNEFLVLFCIISFKVDEHLSTSLLLSFHIAWSRNWCCGGIFVAKMLHSWLEVTVRSFYSNSSVLQSYFLPQYFYWAYHLWWSIEQVDQYQSNYPTKMSNFLIWDSIECVFILDICFEACISNIVTP